MSTAAEWPIASPAPVYPLGTKPVGQPSLLFSPLIVPEFVLPESALGKPITSVTLQGTSVAGQTNVPFKIAHIFHPGALSPKNGLTGVMVGRLPVELQMNVKTTHPDGSVCHAVISGTIPALPPAPATVPMALVPIVAAPRPTPLLTAQAVFDHSPMQITLDVKAKDEIIAVAAAPATATSPAVVGVPWQPAIAAAIYTATTDVTKATRVVKWLEGPTATEYIFDTPFRDANGVAHPFLTAQFSARYHHDTGCSEVYAAVETTAAYAVIRDHLFDVSIQCAGIVRFSQLGLTQGQYRRFRKSFWQGASPALHIQRDSNYLIDSKAVPNLDRRVKVEESYLAMLAKSFGSGYPIMSNGRFTAAMATTGGRPEIGLMPDSHAAYILSMDKRAYDVTMASPELAGGWGAHRRDTSNGSAKGMPLDINHFPSSTMAGTPMDSVNKATGKAEKLPVGPTASKLEAEESHQPAFAYLPYLLSGDFYLLEELHFWCHFNLYSMNCSYRSFEKGLVYRTQVRAQGWSLRTLGECAYITPDDHPTKAAFHHWVNTNMAYYNANFTYRTVVHPNYNNFGALCGNIVYDSGTSMSPWMDDFVTQSVGHIYELLGKPSILAFLKWKVQFPVGRMTAAGYCWTEAGTYVLQVRDSATSPLYETLGECYRNTVTPERLAAGCNASDPMVGYPTSVTGYPSNMQPALAYAADTGIENSKIAWERFDARIVKPNYGFGPQFAIVPRTLVNATIPVPPPVQPPPPPPPPVVVEPPPVVVIPPPPPAVPSTTTSSVKLTGSVIVSASILAGKTKLIVAIYGTTTKAAVLTVTGRTATSTGKITVSSVKLLGGKQYAAYVTTAEGLLLAGVKPT